MPFLPPRIHKTITPTVIELVRQQYLLREQDARRPCTGSFTRIYGLPCSHMLQSLKETRTLLGMNHFEDDHWRYYRRQGPSFEVATLAPRPHQHILDPPVIQGRGRPRRNESSTQRDPSAFERPVPATVVTTISTTTIVSTAITATTTTTTFCPPPLFPTFYLPPSLPSYLGERPVAGTTGIQTLADLLAQTSTATQQPIQQSTQQQSTQQQSTQQQSTQQQSTQQQSAQQPSRQLPTLDEFLIDLKRWQPLQSIPAYRDPNSLASYLAQTGQEDDPLEIVHAREMALATTGLYANCTPTMAYHLAIGNMNAFTAEKTRLGAPERLSEQLSEAPIHQPLKRVAAQKASAAWAGLSPRKRQRRQ